MSADTPLAAAARLLLSFAPKCSATVSFCESCDRVALGTVRWRNTAGGRDNMCGDHLQSCGEDPQRFPWADGLSSLEHALHLHDREQARLELDEGPRCNNGACAAPRTWQRRLGGVVLMAGCDRCQDHREGVPLLQTAERTRRLMRLYPEAADWRTE